MNTFSTIEIGFPLLISLWIFRELWALFLRRNDEPRPNERGRFALPVHPIDNKDYLLAAGIAVAWYVVALWRLGTPDQQFFDEIYHARSGMQYVLGQDPTEWTHPPLAKLLIAASLIVWRVRFDPREGFWKEHTHYTAHQAFAWRYPSVIFGAAALILIYALARTLFRNRLAAALSALIFACDGLFFVQSRIAMTNTFTVFFVLLGTIGTYQFINRKQYSWLLLTGLGLGLALATRWSTLWAWGMTGLLLLWHAGVKLWPEWVEKAQAEDGPRRPIIVSLLQWCGMAAVSMIGIPILIYMLAYIPNILQGPGNAATKLFTWHGIGGANNWAYVLGFKEGMQHNMWAYHSGIKEKHPYSSPWWSWPLLIRPAWYYFERNDAGLVSGIWAIGNAAIWWAAIPTLITMGILAWREKRVEFGLLTLFGLGMWLPWGIEPRSLIFMHYFYESIPFVCLGMAYLGSRLWYSEDENRRTFASCYATLIVAWFIFWYPLLSAFPVSDRYYELHLWLGRTWY